jgi:putative ABC transport system permease protein
MSWLAAIRTATGGPARHKVQAVVIATVLLVSTASATLGLILLSAANAPFQRAFAAQRGADVTLTVDAARTSVPQLAATRSLPGVTAMAGPFPTATVEISFQGNPLGLRTLAGRSSPGGPVDDVSLSAGHWPDGPGQVVLYAGLTGGAGYPTVGSTVTVSGVPGTRSLTVVGFASSITQTADGWVTPAEVARLRPAGAPRTAQLLYRFTAAGSTAQVRADVATVSKALPPGAVAGAAPWLAVEQRAAGNAAIMTPFIVAFALIGLVLAVLIVANLVGGAVVAQYHRIGVLKSIGLTPAQVAAAYLIRVGLPATAGCIAGVLAGNVAAVPVLHKSSGLYGVAQPTAPLWASAAALAGMLALTTLAALGPALRAGRLSAVQAIAAGHAPRAGHGYLAHRLAGRLPLPRAAGIGLATPFARPLRSLVTLAAIMFGVAAVIFAVGLSSGLGRAEQATSLAAAAPVQVQLARPQDAPAGRQDATVAASLRAERGTRRYVPVYGPARNQDVRVPGIAGDINAQAFSGDASWLGYTMITGRWYQRPGQAVVNTRFLADSGLTVGDTVTVDVIGGSTARATVRIVGEVFQPSDNPWLFASTATLPALAGPAHLQGYDVGLRPGTSAAGYIRAVNKTLGPRSPWQAAPPQQSQFYGLAAGLIALLAIMVAVAAGLGVLNTVLMSTRDRTHDLGICKAIGMRPAQLVTMVSCWVAVPGVIAAVIAVPTAMALTTATMHAMASAAHSGVPASFSQVFPDSRLALLSVTGLVIALAGALLPATWAARARTAAALRAE